MNGSAIRFFTMLTLIIATWSAVASAGAPRLCSYNSQPPPNHGTLPNLAPDNPEFEITGTIGAGDATQKGRLATGVASMCDQPRPLPVARDTSVEFNYDAYTFENRYQDASCVTATVYRDGPAGSTLQVAAYLGSFDAARPWSNYLGDAGSDDAAVYNFSFAVPAHTNFDVVLTGAAKGAAPVGYRLVVADCGGLAAVSLEPRSAPTTGGSTMTITGLGFTGAGPFDVVFEPVFANIADAVFHATDVVVVDDQTLTVTLPSAPPGFYHVNIRSEAPPTLATEAYVGFTFTCPVPADPSVPCKAFEPSQGGGSAEAPLACTSPLEPEDRGIYSGKPILGKLLVGAPTQKGLFEFHESSATTPPEKVHRRPTCEAPQPPSLVVDSTTDFPYDAYVFTNRSTTASCFSARVITTPWPYGGNGSSIYLAAYLGSFDPNDIQANVVADNNTVHVNVMHFKVPAQTNFVLVLSARPGTPPLKEPTLPPMDRGYYLYVGGCDPTAPAPAEDEAASLTSPATVSSGDRGERNSASLPEAVTEGDEAAPTSAPAKTSSGDGTGAHGDSAAGCNVSPRDARFDVAGLLLTAAAVAALRRRRAGIR